MSSPPSLPTSASLRPSPRSAPPRLAPRSHALCLPLLLVLFLAPFTTASPYYEREWTGGDDDAPVFEADGTSGGSASRASDPPSLALPRPSATTRTETTADRQIRPETLTQAPTVPSPQILSTLQPTPFPTVLTTVVSLTVVDQSTSAPEAEPTSTLDHQNTRMMEIVANLTKKLGTPQGTGPNVSITFTPDELKKLQEIIGSADLKLKADTTRRQLMIPNGAATVPDLYNYDDGKQNKVENPRFHEKEIETPPSTPSSEKNSTVIDEATLPPTEAIPDDLVLTEPEITDQEIEVQEPIDGDLVESFRPALCKLNTEDELLSIVWMFLQSRIREWGYDEEQSTVLVLTTFGLLLDSEHTLIDTVEPSFYEDVKAGIACIFRDCTRAMPNKRVPERLISMPSSPKLKREATEFHNDLFECRCPSGYVFV